MNVKLNQQKPKFRRKQIKAKPAKNLKTKLRESWRRRHKRMKRVRRTGRKKGKRYQAKTGEKGRKKQKLKGGKRNQWGGENWEFKKERDTKRKKRTQGEHNLNYGVLIGRIISEKK